MSKSVSAKASMSPLVRRLLREGHRVEWLKDGRVRIGGHYFVTKRRSRVVR